MKDDCYSEQLTTRLKQNKTHKRPFCVWRSITLSHRHEKEAYFRLLLNLNDFLGRKYTRKKFKPAGNIKVQHTTKTKT